MRFHAKYVSASEAGDYYQVSFDTEDPGEDSTDPRGPDRPYLIIQRQFETLDGGQCYVETHDHGYVGHFHVRLTNFTRTCLAFEIARKRNTYVEVSCSLDAVEFKEVQRIVNIIFDQHGKTTVGRLTDQPRVKHRSHAFFALIRSTCATMSTQHGPLPRVGRLTLAEQLRWQVRGR